MYKSIISYLKFYYIYSLSIYKVKLFSLELEKIDMYIII